MIPPPPRSTLFPYTTLFRSPERLVQSVSDAFVGFADSSSQPILASSDRKSTRLNSSHVAISYAVFCLKKKKNCESPAYSAPHRDSLQLVINTYLILLLLRTI